MADELIMNKTKTIGKTLESVVRKGRWFQNDEDPDDNVDEDGPLELPSRKFNHIETGVNYFG